MPHRMPRVYIVRHGETSWSLSGQHTGKTDIPLTAHGESVMAELGQKVVGPGKFLDPTHIQHAYISPRQRARKTFELLFAGSEQPANSTEELVQEWDYGKYEGLRAEEIREQFDPKWDIWVDGCPGGESAQEMSDRCDQMIEKIVSQCQTHQEGGGEAKGCHGDVLIVAHGHFTRCFLTRWCRLELTKGRIFVADAGAISICGYQHNSFKERSLLGVNLFAEL